VRQAMGKVLIIEDAAARQMLQAAVIGARHEVIEANNRAEALGLLQSAPIDLVIVALKRPDAGCRDLIEAARNRNTAAAVMVTAAPEDVDLALQAVQNGAWDFIRTPIDAKQLGIQIERALRYVRLLRENETLRRQGSSINGWAGKPLAEVEKQVILSALEQFKGHRVKTASALGIGVRTLGMKLKRWRQEGQLIESAH
jgi:DNA-binding NtrC family response regulator